MNECRRTDGSIHFVIALGIGIGDLGVHITRYMVHGNEQRAATIRYEQRSGGMLFPKDKRDRIGKGWRGLHVMDLSLRIILVHRTKFSLDCCILLHLTREDPRVIGID